MTFKKLLPVILTAVLMTLSANYVFAHPGHQRSPGYGCQGYAQDQITAEQQKQLDDLESRYSDRLTQLDKSLEEQWDTYREARSNPDTRVAELDQLRNKINDLRAEYRLLRIEWQDKARSIAPESYQNYGSPGYCGEYRRNYNTGYCNGPGYRYRSHGRHWMMHDGMRGYGRDRI